MRETVKDMQSKILKRRETERERKRGRKEGIFFI